MKSEWKVTSNYVCEQKLFGVYRLRDVGAVDHSGNREYGDCGWLESKEDAVCIAERLNRNEKAPAGAATPDAGTCEINQVNRTPNKAECQERAYKSFLDSLPEGGSYVL